ncbi:MAG: nitronate monooxygenase, partial [Pseudomonadota bacterium]|nr:nitronate monooxygenase [Pseudomonadota bacterium]
VRAIFDGPLVLAGGVSDGVALKAAVTLGCDLAYMGTRFIATRESMAVQGHKDMLVTSSLDDVMLTSAFTGLPLSKLSPSIVAAGLDPDALPERGMIDITKDINPDKRPKRWKDTWSAGYTVSGVIDIPNVETLVDCLADEYLNSE